MLPPLNCGHSSAGALKSSSCRPIKIRRKPYLRCFDCCFPNQLSRQWLLRALMWHSYSCGIACLVNHQMVSTDHGETTIKVSQMGNPSYPFGQHELDLSARAEGWLQLRDGNMRPEILLVVNLDLTQKRAPQPGFDPSAFIESVCSAKPQIPKQKPGTTTAITTPDFSDNLREKRVSRKRNVQEKATNGTNLILISRE